MLRLGRLVYGRLLFAMQIFVLAVRLCLKRDFRHIAHQSRQSLIATTSLRFALGFCRRSSPAAACSIIWHDIAQKKEQFARLLFFLCGYSATIFTFPPNLPLRKGGYKLGERLSNHSSFYGVAGIKGIYFQRYSRFTSLLLGGRVPFCMNKGTRTVGKI